MMTKLQEYWVKLQDFWQKRDQREQKTMQIGGILLAILLVYALIYSPMIASVDALRKHIITQEKTLAWMQDADVKIKKLTSREQKDSNVSPVALLGALQSSLETANLQQFVAPLKQTSNDVIELHFQKVDFDKLMTFLIQFLQKEPLSIAQFSAVATDNIGQVNADIQLKIG